MKCALDLAYKAEAHSEVPVGAIVVHDNQIIGSGFNSSINTKDPTAHAEIMAIRAAALHINNYRLVNTSLYVTLEPCSMCAGAMIHARISNLFFATCDPRAGAVCSVLNILDNKNLNHQVSWQEGILAKDASELLKNFFRMKRKAAIIHT